MKKSLKPTRKWFAALAGGSAALLAHFAATDFTFGDTEEAMVVNLAAALALAYMKSNDQTAPMDGVEAKVDGSTHAGPGYQAD